MGEKHCFDATTFLNGSESTQSINYILPSAEGDMEVINDLTLMTPGLIIPVRLVTVVRRINSMNIRIQNKITLKPNIPASTKVTLSPYFAKL
ncbi:hypothetical protein [Psychrobacter immobilis]|uniref:hypothetical protein n=1 Tax=Psychrobacter immobilis TaxID=498 RepID=UPI00191AB269|nr:hypothetical protein [Psychrobacter immobilis]